MSTTYEVRAGDTFDSISRKQYGTEGEAERIFQANPGVRAPLIEGVVLVIPPLPDAPQDLLSQAISDGTDEVAILIEGSRFRFWDTIRIVRSIDAMDIIEFGAPFDDELPSFKALFRPFSYKNIVVTVGGIPLFTGTMVAVTPVLENARRIVSVGGYSIPGVLNDCTPPASAFPLEFNNQGLRDIAKSLLAPFGVSLDFQIDQGAVFEQVAARPEKKVLAFLAELAKQRNLVISSTPRGALLFWRSVSAGSPVQRLQQGLSPVLAVTPFFSPQEYYSHITGIEPVVAGLAGSQFTVKNPRLEGVVRPLTFSAQDTVSADVKAAVEAKASRMFGNMVSYSVQVNTWRDSKGSLWAPNTTITLLAPGAMIYTGYEFIIRSIEFNRGPAAETATLNLVVPGSFSGQIPETLPWDE